ncbi:MAG: hypothetical protein ACM34K_10510 [Bacillota bacterium]
MKGYLLFLIIILSAVTLAAQEQNPETVSKVKELSEFHGVIYKLWHIAWPKKDIRMLAELLPEIESGAERVKDAELPGILREKKGRWAAGVIGLMSSVESYKDAISRKDSSAIIQSAELLHGKYEGLVRIIKPVIKEVDQFHQELYILYHYYMPGNNIEKIITSAKNLGVKITDLEKANLPEKFASKKNEFNNAVQSLKLYINKLNMVINSKNENEIKTAIISVHSEYQALENIFE